MGFFDRKTRRFFGGTGLHRIDWNVRAFEIGYWIRASAAGNGYVTEMAELLTEMCFDVLTANRVSIHVAAANLKSAAIPARLGFTREGSLRNSIKDADGNLHDRVIYAMTPEEWKSRSPQRNP